MKHQRIGSMEAVPEALFPIHHRPGLNCKAATALLLNRLISEHPDGFTYDPFTGLLVVPRPGCYAISLHGHECQSITRYTPSDLLRWIDAVEDALSPGRYMGFWPHPDAFHVLDLSVMERGRAAAARMALKQRQDSVFSGDSLSSIVTDELLKKSADAMPLGRGQACE